MTLQMSENVHKKRTMKYLIAPTRSEIVARKICDLIFETKKSNLKQTLLGLQAIVDHFKKLKDNDLVNAMKAEVSHCHPEIVDRINW